MFAQLRKVSYYLVTRRTQRPDERHKMSNWKNATKELRQAGIRVNVSVSACCMGCADLPNLDPDQPALYSLVSRFNSYDGGMVYHQNIADTELAAKVNEIFERNEVDIEWDGSDSDAIFVGQLDPWRPLR